MVRKIEDLKRMPSTTVNIGDTRQYINGLSEDVEHVVGILDIKDNMANWIVLKTNLLGYEIGQTGNFVISHLEEDYRKINFNYNKYWVEFNS